MNPAANNVVKNAPGVANNDGANKPGGFNGQGYNTFDRNSLRLSTQQLSQVLPIRMTPEIEGNVARVGVSHDLRTFTLKAPNLTGVSMQKSFYQVPWIAICPNSWEDLYRIPLDSEDIIYKDVLPNVPTALLYRGLLGLMGVTSSSSSVSFTNEAGIVNAMFYASVVFGNNSLLKNLGKTLPSTQIGDLAHDFLVKYYSIDWTKYGVAETSVPALSFSLEDGFMTSILPGKVSQSAICQYIEDVRQNWLALCIKADDYGANADMARALYYLNRADGVRISSAAPNFQVSTSTYEISAVTKFNDTEIPELVELAEIIVKILQMLPLDVASLTVSKISDLEEYGSVNLMPVIAYQTVIAQFFTNDHIDDIYTSDMWHKVLGSWLSATQNRYNNTSGTQPFRTNPFYAYVKDIVQMGVGTSVSDYTYFVDHYDIAGVSKRYDVFNGRFMRATLNSMSKLAAGAGTNTSPSEDYQSQCSLVGIFMALFSLGTSLKYSDYFTDGRTRPLAHEDVTVQVSTDNRVSVLDTNYGLWYQRLLNAVNRSRHDIIGYLKAIAGVEPDQKTPQPNWIATETYQIGGMEIENTAQDQGNVVTLLRNKDSRYIYECFCDSPSFIIGVQTFSVPMIYPDASAKIFEMNDRFDWFNHFLQETGDQALTRGELSSRFLLTEQGEPFAYALRYLQFKKAFSEATGGFAAGALPGWALLFTQTDANGNSSFEGDENYQVYYTNIGPSFIRNRNYDFDKMYSSLTGTNDATRIHFITANFFEDKVNSRQAKFPTLLG